jgi:DNA-binding NarL/FixJ family response regulator
MDSQQSSEIPRTNLWLVDDDASLREAVSQALAAAGTHFHLAGSFGAPAQVLAALDRGEEPHVALVDLGLPEMGGEALLRELRQRRPHLPLVAFTIRADDEAVFSALRAGARGYITQDASVSELTQAMEEAVRGGAPLSRSVSLRVVSRFWQAEGGASSTAVSSLTRRERAVLEVLCTGASYREAGRWLGLAEGTIQTHVKNIYEKLGVCSKAEAVRVACEAGVAAPR